MVRRNSVITKELFNKGASQTIFGSERQSGFKELTMNTFYSGLFSIAQWEEKAKFWQKMEPKGRNNLHKKGDLKLKLKLIGAWQHFVT